jgi:hypothetical protein
MMQTARDLVYWQDPKASAFALAAGLACFFIVGVLGWSVLGLACVVNAGHMALRLVYYNTVGKRPEPPAEWISEAEVQKHAASLTKHANAVARNMFALVHGADAALTAQWIAALGFVAFLARIFGTTGLLFLLFVAAFSVPRAYELKRGEADAAIAWLHAKALEVHCKAAELCKGALAKVPTIPAASDLAKSDQTEKKKL